MQDRESAVLKDLAKAAPALLELVGQIPKLLDAIRELNKLVTRVKKVEAELAEERRERLRTEKVNAERSELMRVKIAHLEGKMDHLENQERRNNLVFFGLEDASNGKESWEDVSEKVKELVTKKLGVNLERGDIERAHRLGRGPGRPVIAKFASWRKRDEILTNRKRLADTDQYIKEDFSLMVRQKRKALAPLLKKARDEGKRVKMIYDHLIVDGIKIFAEDSGETRTTEWRVQERRGKTRPLHDSASPCKTPLKSRHTELDSSM